MNKNLLCLLGLFIAVINCDKAFAQWNTYRGPVNNATYISLAIAPDETKYLAFQDGYSKCSVYKYTGVGPNWAAVGSPLFSAGNAIYESLAIDNNGILYVAYQDGGYSNKCTVMKFNGSNWVALGTEGISAGAAAYESLAIDKNGTPYVAYQDGADSNKSTVMKFNGTNWVTVGTAGFSAGSATSTSLDIDATGTPYVAYEDGSNGNKSTVMKFNGTNWVTVGSAGFSAGQATSEFLKISPSGTPYIGYIDGANSSEGTVMKYNDTTWVNVGPAGFAHVDFWLGDAFPCLAFSKNGVPNFGFQDLSEQRLHVMQFDGTNWDWVGGQEYFTPGNNQWVSLAIDTSNEITVVGTWGGNPNGGVIMETFDCGQAAITSQPSPATPCRGNNALFSLQATGGNGTLTYQWQENRGAGFYNLSDNSNYSGSATDSLTVNSVADSMNGYAYRCQVFNACYDYTNSDSVTLNIRDLSLPLVVGYASPDTLCPGSNLTLTASGTLTYSWNNGATNGVAFPASSSIQSYVVTGTDTNGCYGLDTVNIFVRTPKIASSVTDTTICIGSILTLTGEGAFVPGNYSWSNGVTNGVAFVTDTSATYTVLGIDSTGCTGTATATVTVDNPTGSIYISSNPVCRGSSVTLADASPNISIDSWDNGVNDWLSFYPTTTTTYHLTATSIYGCTSIDSVTIYVDSVGPVITSTSNNVTVCAGVTNVQISVAGGSSDLTYQWSVDEGGWTNPLVNNLDDGDNDGNYYDVICTGTTTDTLNVLAPTNSHGFVCTVTNGCGSTSTNDIYVNVSSSPLNPNTVPSTVCVGSDVRVYASSDSNYSYSWSGGITNGEQLQIDSTAEYYVSVTDSFGCSYQDSITIQPYQPDIQAVQQNYQTYTLQGNLCTGDSTMVIGQGMDSYVWANGINNATWFLPSSTATYYVTGYNNDGCVRYDSITIQVYSGKPVIVTQPIAQSGCANSAISFISKATGPGLQLYWGEQVYDDIQLNGWNDIPNALWGTQTDTLTIVPQQFYDSLGFWSDSVARRAINACGVTESNFAHITLAPAQATTITSASSNLYSANITWNPGSCASSYILRYSTDTNSWVIPYSAANDTNYGITGLQSGTKYYAQVAVVAGPDTSAWSATDTFTTLYSTIAITSQPANDTLCSGNNAMFTIAATGTGLTYQWQGNSGGGFSNISDNSTYSGTATDSLIIYSAIAGLNNISFRCVVSGGGTSDTSNAGILIVNTITVTVNTSADSICAGGSVTLTGSGTATSYTWDNGVTDSVAFTPSTTTTYHVTGTNANGCSATDSITITVNSLPIVTATASATTVCSGSPDTLRGSGAVNYSWDNGVTDGQSFTPSATTTYHVTGTNSNGCTAIDSVTITVNPSPVASISSQTNVLCYGGSTGAATVTLSGSASPYTYSWSPSGGNAATASSLVAGTYTLTGTDANGCSVSKVVDITQPAAALTVRASSTNITCNGANNGTITLTVTGGTPPYLYDWEAGQNTAKITNLHAEEYAYIVLDYNRCRSAEGEVTITQPTVLAATVGSQTNVGCNGGSTGAATVTASGGTSPYTYSWSHSAGTASRETGLAVGTYTVSVTDAHGCSLTKTVTITQSSAVTASVGSQTNVNCTNGSSGSATVTLSGGTTPYTYSWSPSGGTAATATGLTVGTYTLTGTDVTGCSVAQTVTITPTNSLVITASASDTTVCAGNNLTLTGAGATSYSWNNGVTNGVSFTPSSTTTYHVTGSDGNGCSAVDSITITVNPLPTVTANASVTSVCAGGPVTLSGSGNATSYTWDNGVTDGVAFTPSATTTYHVTGTNGNGCTATDSIIVTVNQLPTVTANTSSTSACIGNNVTLTGGGAFTYTWDNGVTNGVSFVPSSTTTYHVIGTDGNGCTAEDSVTITVGYPSMPSISISSSTNVCNGNTVNLTAVSHPVGYAVSLNGSNQYFISDDLTQFYKGISNSFTIEIRFKAAAAGDIVDEIGQPSQDNGWHDTQIELEPDGTLLGRVWGVSDFVLGNVTMGTWNQVVLRYNDTTQITDGFVNGVASPQTASGGRQAPYNYGFLQYWAVGCTDGTNLGDGNYFQGDVREMRIWNAALSGSQIATQWDTTVAVNSPKLISYYRMDEGSGTILNDASAHGDKGTMYNNPTWINYTQPFDNYTAFSWSNGGTGNSIPITNSGTYTVNVSDAIGCSGSTSLTVNLFSPAATSNATPNPVCPGSGTMLSGNGINSYSWDQGISNGQTIYPSISATYHVTATDDNGCSGADSVQVIVNPLPTVTANASADTVCAGNSVTLTGSGTATSYTWDNNITNGVAFADTATAMFTVTGTDGNGCTATDSIMVSVNPAPIVHANASGTNLCAGQHITLYGSGNSVSGYTWDNGVFDGEDLFPLSTTYHVTGSASDGCSAMDSVTIIVKDTPTVTATASANYFCAGGSVTLTSGGNAQLYGWNNNVTDGVAFVDTATQIYTVIGTGANGCTSSASVAVVVNKKLPLEGPGDITASTTGTSCSAIVNYAAAIYGTNILINGGAEEGYTGWTIDQNGGYGWNDVPYATAPHSGNGVFSTSYEWDVMEQTVDLVANGYSSAYLNTSPAISVGEWYTASSCCSATDNYFFTAEVRDSNNNVIASFNFGTENNPIECTQGWQQVSYTFSGYPAGARYVRIVHGGKDNEDWAGWYGTSMDDATVRVALPDTITYDINPGSAFNIGTTTVHAMATNECGTDTVAFNVTVTSSPASITANGSTTFCAGGNVTLDAGAGYASYAWSTGDTTETITVDTASNYSVTVTGVGGCTSTASQSVTVNPLPTVQANTTQDTICAGTNITLWGSGSAVFFNWDNNVQDGVGFNPTGTTTYHVTGTDWNGCSAMDSITITVNNLPAVTANTSSASICQGNNLTLTGGGAQTYTWNNNVTDGVTFVPSGTNTYTVTGTDMNGCTDTASVTVTVNSLPVVKAYTSANDFCAGTDVTLTGSGAETYTWDNNVTNGVAFADSSTKTYHVTGTNALGCSSTASVEVSVYALPAVTAHSTATSICAGSDIMLTGGGAYTYTWNNNATNKTEFIPAATETYIVTGTDVHGCTNTASVTITVNNLPVVAAIASADSVCAGSKVMLTGSGAQTYAWNNNVVNGVAFAPAATKTYTVTGTDQNGCKGTASKTVTLNAAPVVKAAASGTSICTGTDVTLTGSGAVTYTWNDNVINGVAFVPTVTKTYTVTGTDVHGCTGTAEIAVTLLSLPDVKANASSTGLCNGGTVTLTGSGAATYTWNNNVTNGVAFAPSATNRYTVTGTNPFGCRDTASVTVTVNSLPGVTANSTATAICAGGDVTLTGSGATTYTWNNNVTNGTAFAPSSTQTYIVTGTDGNGCTGSGSVTVTVNNIPTSSVANAGSNATANTITANWNVSEGATAYYLDVATDDSFSNFARGYNNLNAGNVTSYIVRGLSASTTYYYRVRAADSCGTSGSSNVISYSTIGVDCSGLTGGTVSPAVSLICSEVSTELSVSGNSGGTLQWQVSNDNINWSNAGYGTGSLYIAAPASQNEYYRCLTTPPSCPAIASTTGVVYITVKPEVTITNVTATSATISWTPYVPGMYNLAWSGAGTGSVPAITSNNYTITGLNPGQELQVSVSPLDSTCSGASAGLATSKTLCATPDITSLTAAAAPSHAFKVEWTAVNGASSYRIYYRDMSSSGAWQFTDTTGTAKTISVANGGQTYAVYVAAANCPSAGMIGEGSSIDYITTNPLTACTTVPTVTAVSNCFNQITVNLSGGSGSYSLKLKEISPAVTAGASYTVNSSVVNITLGNQFAGSVWEVSASSVCSGVLSPVSNVAIVTVKPACPAVSNVVISDINCNGFAVTWNPNDCAGMGISNYELMIKKTTDLNYTGYDVSKESNYDIVNWLQGNNSYDVALMTISCNNAMSALSTPVTAVISGCRNEQESENTTSDNTKNVNESVSIYPNPAQYQFSVDIGRTDMTEAPVKIELMTELGQVVQTDLSAISGGHLSQQITAPAGISSGIYFVRTSVGSNVYVNKIMIVNQ